MEHVHCNKYRRYEDHHTIQYHRKYNTNHAVQYRILG